MKIKPTMMTTILQCIRTMMGEVRHGNFQFHLHSSFFLHCKMRRTPSSVKVDVMQERRKKRKTSLDVFMRSLPSTNMNWHKSKCSLGWAFKTDLCDVVLCSVWLQKLVEMMILMLEFIDSRCMTFPLLCGFDLTATFQIINNSTQQHDIKNYILQFTTKKNCHFACFMLAHRKRSCRVIISPSTFIFYSTFFFSHFSIKNFFIYYTHLEHATWK